MIPVKKMPAPPDFASRVAQNANTFLSRTPNPTPADIRNKPYWRDVLDDLHERYNEICAYSALWCPRGMATVDHYKPIHVCVAKQDYQSAYEWDNFRLASYSMNTEKNLWEDVCDPFLIEIGWFVLDFPSLMIKCGSSITPTDREKVEATIKRLKLNQNAKYIEYRLGFLRDYCLLCLGDCPIETAFKHLELKAPFIAFELKRQDLVQKIIQMMFPK